MKRVVCFFSALALAVGAIAPAAFASDAGYGQTDLIPLEDLDQETFDNYLAKFYSQDYPTYGVLDLIRDTFQGGLSNASGLNDSPWSWALNLVDNASDLGTEIGLWMQGVQIDPNTGKVIYPDDYLTDYAKQQLDSQLMSPGDIQGGTFTIGSGTWVTAPYSPIYGRGYNTQYQGNKRGGSWPVFYNVYMTSYSGGVVFCSYTTDNFYAYSTLSDNTTLALCNQNYSKNSIVYKYGYATNFTLPIGVQYSSLSAAVADFYGHDEPTATPSWNGSGYYSDHQESFSINLPSLPSTNWGNLSKYYYTTYGDEIYEGDINRYYYDIANNFAPYEVSYELPYWLINGSSNVLDFNYDLELPDADLYSVPSDFEGGSGFWDKAFSSLGGFGAFIMLGLSFGLVALFFKD